MKTYDDYNIMPRQWLKGEKENFLQVNKWNFTKTSKKNTSPNNQKEDERINEVQT